jgi:hypothetical protein
LTSGLATEGVFTELMLFNWEMLALWLGFWLFTAPERGKVHIAIANANSNK